MWNETVARAVVAERLAAAAKAAQLKPLVARSEDRPARSRWRRWRFPPPIHSAAPRVTSAGSTPA
jgi:hypothetical protein